MKLEKQAAIRFSQNTLDLLQAQSDRSGLAISDLVRQAVDLLMAETATETVPFTYHKAMDNRQTGSDEVWLGSLYARLTAYDDGAVVLTMVNVKVVVLLFGWLSLSLAVSISVLSWFYHSTTIALP